MFRWSYLTAARTIKVADPDWTRVDGGAGLPGEDRPTMARRRLKAALGVHTVEQYAVVEAVAGWDALAGNSRRLTKLRDGLDELYRLWF
jgi:hypothetical protein